jgi:hypothetical protein
VWSVTGIPRALQRVKKKKIQFLTKSNDFSSGLNWSTNNRTETYLATSSQTYYDPSEIPSVL